MEVIELFVIINLSSQLQKKMIEENRNMKKWYNSIGFTL